MFHHVVLTYSASASPPCVDGSVDISRQTWYFIAGWTALIWAVLAGPAMPEWLILSCDNKQQQKDLKMFQPGNSSSSILCFNFTWYFRVNESILGLKHHSNYRFTINTTNTLLISWVNKQISCDCMWLYVVLTPKTRPSFHTAHLHTVALQWGRLRWTSASCDVNMGESVCLS